VEAGGIKENLERIRGDIAAAAKRSGRPASAVTLLAITKTVPAPVVAEAVKCGVTEVGENRVQEAKGKMPLLPSDLTWHMVGRLQTNKAREAARLFSLIHSLDREELALALDRAGEAAGKPVNVLVQVSLTGAPQQGGVPAEKLSEFIEKSASLRYVDIQGLMALGPWPAGEAEIRQAYRSAKELFDRVARGAGEGFRTLSLGMSGDYRVAVEEGSTLVRIGTAIFGERRRDA
jgi:hypothetical protein